MTRLRQLMVLSRDLARSKQFYQEGLGLKLLRSSETFAEFDIQASVPLCVKLAQSEAACCSGYSPFLNFDIMDLSDAVPRLLMLGAIMDGPIKYPAHGKVAALRSPDGVMIGLYEPNSWDNTTMGNVVSWVAQCFYPEDQVFWAAARYNDTHTIQVAVSRLTPETRKYLEWQEPYTGRTPLLEAAAKGHCNCARLLIEAGANCNAKDLRMNTPLHLACKRAQLEMVPFLLQVSAVNPFEVNLGMKTPLDLARSRFSEEEEEEEARLYAKCIQVLEKKSCLYSGWLYKKTDNVLSLVSGISSLNSWTRRFCMVLERGDPTVLELAFFRMKNGSGVRPVCPTSVMLYNVAAGMETISDPRWFSPKDFTFLVRGDQLNKCHYRASSAIQNLVYFAAIDQESFDAWKVFFIHQQQRLADRRHSIVSRHDNGAGWNSRSMVPAASLVTLPPNTGLGEEGDNCRAIGLSSRTTAHTLGSTDAALSRPPLPVSAPDWDDWEECELVGNAAETKERRAEVEASFASEQNLPVGHNGEISIGECVICFDGRQSAVCVPCGHNAVCMKCAEEIQSSTAECPVCRAHVRELIKLYRV